MMDPKRLSKSLELEQQIKELRFFIETVVTENKGAYQHVSSFVNIENKRTIQLFGSRFFGCGSHSTNIIIPKVLLTDIIESAKKRIQELENKYRKL